MNGCTKEKQPIENTSTDTNRDSDVRKRKVGEAAANVVRMYRHTNTKTVT